MFRQLIWGFPEGADSSRAALRKFLVAQAMRHYQNVDVTLDLILEAYSTQQGRFPALDAGFSFRIAGMVNTDVLSKSEIVQQYIDALYERLKRSEERRVGKEVVSTYSFRGTTSH